MISEFLILPPAYQMAYMATTSSFLHLGKSPDIDLKIDERNKQEVEIELNFYTYSRFGGCLPEADSELEGSLSWNLYMPN
jgi:hypothetical protein